VATLSLSAVRGTRRKTSIAHTANRLLAVVLRSKSLQRGLNNTTSKTQYKVQSGLLLDIVVGKGTAVFKLLTSKDKTLLIWRNSLLVLDLGLDVVNGVRRFHLEGDGLTGQGLDETIVSVDSPAIWNLSLHTSAS
jgi:hypothetical protein